MSMPMERGAGGALAAVETARGLKVRQIKEWGEILTGWETRNRYEVQDADGQQLFFAGEAGGGLGGFLLRSFLKNARPFTIELKDAAGRTVLTVRRPWRWWFARAEVFGEDGVKLGAIQQRFAFFKRHYTLEGPHGEAAAEIEGPFFRPWTFFVRQEGREVAKIAKQWGGLFKEAFTSADSFSLEFQDTVGQGLRAVLLGAMFLIDFVHFEKRN